MSQRNKTQCEGSISTLFQSHCQTTKLLTSVRSSNFFYVQKRYELPTGIEPRVSRLLVRYFTTRLQSSDGNAMFTRDVSLICIPSELG